MDIVWALSIDMAEMQTLQAYERFQRSNPCWEEDNICSRCHTSNSYYQTVCDHCGCGL